MRKRATLTSRGAGRKPSAKGSPRSWPTRWLFTDAARLPDPLPAIAMLPRGLGVVLRHYGVAGRDKLIDDAARLCRARGLALLVAGADHLPQGLVRPKAGFAAQPLTAAAHDAAAIVRAWRAGAAGVFISPVFATSSHPGAVPLGPLRFAILLRLARRYGLAVFALGGMDERSWRRLRPLQPHGYGAIGAFLRA